MNALRIWHFWHSFCHRFHSNRNWKKQPRCSHLEKRLRQKKEYYPLTNRARGSYWGIKVVPVRTERRKRTDRSKVRTKIDRRPIFPVRLEQASSRKYFIIWNSGQACFDFAGFRKQKVYSLWPFPWKRSVLRNPDQERTNQKHRISFKTTLPYYKLSYAYTFSDL